jgi:hypothetical protein
MGTGILITIADIRLSAELNNSYTAEKFKKLLPLELLMSRWGNEYYGDCGINVEMSSDARDIMEMGELAVWPSGKALCIFFGPTPASKGTEPRAISPVNPIGKIIDNPGVLKNLGSSIKVSIHPVRKLR